jgi:hypothetical protein
LLACAAPVAAQNAAGTLPCAGQRIDAIVVHTTAPTVAVLRNVPVLAEVVRSLHTTTHPDVIRRFLLLGEGDECDELRRAESERILRAQPFIADASVLVIPSDFGGVTLDVQTSDEIAVVLGGTPAFRLPPARFVRVGNANVNGMGVYLATEWRDGGVYRDGYGGKLVDNQFMGRPYQLAIEGHQNPLGSNWLVESAHPFYTDLQRVAWRARSGADDDYIRFPASGDDEHALHVARRYFDVGGIVRLGPPGRLSLFGASFSGNDERPASAGVLVTRAGLRDDPASLLSNRYESHRIARANVLWGVRDIGFLRVRGFDALNATQDLPVGFQIGTMFGRSLSVLGSRDDDIFLASDLYVGAGGSTFAFRMQAQGEGRRRNDTNMWDGVLTTGRAVQYARLTSANTLTGTLEWSGGWQQRLPFALTLGDLEGGIRGFAGARTAGAQRLVGRLEDRMLFGRVFGLGDLGAAMFVDAGRLWGGDIPYGETTPMRPAVGVSLLGAVPSGSARLWRLELTMAPTPDRGGRRFALRIFGVDKTLFFFREPNDVQQFREQTVPSSVFRWP